MITHGSDKRFTPSDYLLEFKTKSKEEATTKDAAVPPSQDWKRLKMIAMMYAAASKADETKKQNRKGRSR